MIQDFFDLILDIVLWVPRYIYSFIGDVIIAFLDWLPQDSINVQGALDGWGGDFLYFMGVFEVDYGITAIFTAYIARFLLRRVPIIG